jgi:hypothetical protein
MGDGMNWYAYVGNNPVTRIDPMGLADIFLSVEAELAVVVGVDVSIGIVYDTDHPWESGVFVSGGGALGATAGVGAGAGFALRDIEGPSYNGDANIWLVSGTASFDQPRLEAFNGATVTVGPGVGGAYSETNTLTLTVRRVVDAAKGAGRWLWRHSPWGRKPCP